jgi:uncharacterized protein (TIGR02452 family)
MNRARRETVAQETVAIVERGSYESPGGHVVDIAAAVDHCIRGTRFYSPEQLKRIRNEVLARSPAESSAAIEVRNETTLEGIARLLAETGGPVAALNFASARNPGGGFLGGAQAQEESLARSSALYASLLQAPEYYDRHRKMKSCLYSDAMILSPDCPILRDDHGQLLEQPLMATFITSAAPNAGAIAKNAPTELQQIPDVLRRRIEYVLTLAAFHGYGAIVLGAWGCGAFRNDPEMVAALFAEHLGRGGPWAGRFRRIVFSVLDTSDAQTIVDPFRHKLHRT